MDTAEGKNLPVPHCIKGSDGWKLDAKVQAALDKKTYKALEKPTFGSTELPEYIKGAYDPAELEIQLIGLCTDICVISNAIGIKAFLPEVKVIVDSACCAGVTPESHQNALNAMKMCQIEIL
jgi:nicotinamidase-related amidase